MYNGGSNSRTGARPAAAPPKGGLMKSITSTGYNPARLGWEESVFHTANGYLGVRSSPEEGAPEGVFSVRGAYINGFYDIKDIPYGEKLYGFPETQQTTINLMDVQTVRLWVEGERFTLSEGEVLKYDRELFLDRGVSEKRVLWRSPQGREVFIRARRMASLEQKELFLMKYAVMPMNFSGEVVLESEESGEVSNFFNPNDPRVAAEALKHLHITRAEHTPGGTLLAGRTDRSNLEIACAVAHQVESAAEKETWQAGERLFTRFKAHVLKEESLTLTKWCVYADSRRHPDAQDAAQRILEDSLAKGLQHFLARQTQILSAFWAASRVEVEGDKALQSSLDYSLYTLLCSAGWEGISSVGAKGLSGEGYEGHYFWDTEIYVFPFFLMTNRDIAKGLLEYRYNILEKAREHARLMGHPKGALYAWRTITGSECSGYYPSGSAQYHLTGDVSHAFIQYYLATGDISFMKDRGAEVLVETARLWLDAGHEEKGQFRIDAVTGPDEYTCVVNNNFYTNAVARENLSWAAKIIKILDKQGMAEDVRKKLNITKEELRAFERAAKRMYLPYDKDRDIHAQDDSFLRKQKLDLKAIPKENFPLLLHYHPLWLYRHQVCKQADTVLAHYLFENLTEPSTMANSYAYYEQCTTHDSSLSTCVFSIMAAKLGDLGKAMDYFNRSATLDLDDTHGNTRDGIHTANMGGSYLAMVAGFGGMRIKEDGLHLSPQLPEKWEGYAFRLRYQDSLIACRVRRKGCVLEVLEGKDVKVYVHGQKVKLKKGERTKVDA